MHENVYLSAFTGGNSAGRPLPRYGRIWPRSHMRGTCITPERLIECRMGEIVSFRRARKKAARQLAEGMASANRLRHGRSKAERELETKRAAKSRRDLDRHRIETGDER
jgi:hypothetical protein